MREVVDTILSWRAAGHDVAVARLVLVEGSGPRSPGATMALADDGRIAGSVAGGCVESALVEEAGRALGQGTGRLVRFDQSDDELAVGLACGGTLTVLVAPAPPSVLAELADALERGAPATLATLLAVHRPQAGERDATAGDRCFVAAGAELDQLSPGSTLLLREDGTAAGTLGAPGLDEVVVRDAGGAGSGTAIARYATADGASAEVFLERFAPPPELVVVGAVDFAAALSRQAKLLGFRVTVCDPRAAFATSDRFPAADEVVAAWPDRVIGPLASRLGPGDAICVLTHDERLDVPAIAAALATRVGYVGALGSRRTTADRRERLVAAGLPADALARLHAPIGLDIGARSPEETALAICAEIVAAQTGRRGAPLAGSEEPIHPRPRG